MFIAYDLDTDEKLTAIFREHCNLRCEECGEIRAWFITLVAGQISRDAAALNGEGAA